MRIPVQGLHPLCAGLLLLGCANEPAVDPFEDSPFALELEGETVRPREGWIQRTDESSQIEIRYSAPDGATTLNIDVHRRERPFEPLLFEVGDTIVDGPAEDGRGPLAQYTGDFAGHSPWIDARLCVEETAASEECFQGQLITLTIDETTDPDWVWVRFSIEIDELDEPVEGAYRTLVDAGDLVHDHYPRPQTE